MYKFQYPESTDLTGWNSKFNDDPLIFTGRKTIQTQEYWRFFTYSFVHWWVLFKTYESKVMSMSLSQKLWVMSYESKVMSHKLWVINVIEWTKNEFSGLSHLIGNVSFQLLIGIPLEYVHGSFRVGIFYCVGVIVGSMTALIVTPQSALVGASGGDFCLVSGKLKKLNFQFSNYLSCSC